jgi:hypothetical protein
MKIRPDKFSMDFNDSQEYSQQSRVVASSNYPTTYLDLANLVRQVQKLKN